MWGYILVGVSDLESSSFCISQSYRPVDQSYAVRNHLSKSVIDIGVMEPTTLDISFFSCMRTGHASHSEYGIFVARWLFLFQLRHLPRSLLYKSHIQPGRESMFYDFPRNAG